MKQSVTETEIDVLEKMQERVLSDAAFKAWPFLSGFNFACKNDRVTAATYKYYRPLVVNPIITNSCKKLYLKCGRIPRSIFANVAMHGFMWKPVFFLIISKCCHLYRKSLFFPVTFLQYDEVF